MRHARVFRWQIPLNTGKVLRSQQLKTRDGLLVQLQETGHEGWGEIAPLPGFSMESLSQAQTVLLQWVQQWQMGGQPDLPVLASVAFGVSCALAELHNRLPQTAVWQTTPLYNGNQDEFLAKLTAMPADKLGKIKVGREDPVQEGNMVNQLLLMIPDLKLRLDANRAWNRQQASQFASCLAPESRFRILFLEEPCATCEDSLAFARASGIAIAWDESLREQGLRLATVPGVAALVIKPMLTGSLETVSLQVQVAHQAGLMAVISASIESSFALTQLARIAAWLTPNTPAGLDTLNLLQRQLIRRWPGSHLPCCTAENLERLI